jgi:very-short-patch-repair endonuclease
MKKEITDRILARRGKTRFARKLRKRMTEAEMHLWNALRDRGCAGVKFRRQVPLGGFIADFCSLRPKLVIEVDGHIHDRQIEYDMERSRYLEERGFAVMRLSNGKVLRDLPGTLKLIVKAVGTLQKENKT